MSRVYCNACLRPQVSCICHLICPIINKTHLVILQHPSEVKQTKGTVSLLSLSLTSVDVFVGENFSNHEPFLSIIKKYKNKIALLYPSKNINTLSLVNDFNKEEQYDIQCIIVLDGTWKKAFKLYMMNPFLHNILHCELPSSIEGEYLIRKVKKEGALSTLEACCYAMSLIESKPKKYEGLIEKFREFNHMLLSFKTDKGIVKK